MKNNKIPLLPGVYYHIFNHANGFENLFLNEGNYQYFLKKYAEHIPPVADTLAYCLMPNHIHLMVRIKPENQLPESLSRSLGTGSSVSNKPSRLSRDEVLAFFGGRDAFLAAHEIKPDDRFLKMVSEWY